MADDEYHETDPVSEENDLDGDSELVTSSASSLSDSSSTSNSTDDDRTYVDIDQEKLKLLITDDEMEVPITPILITAAGLPNSQKTSAINELFKSYKLSDAHTDVPVYPPLEHAGIEWYELVGLCNRRKQKVKYLSKGMDTCYLYAMYSVLSQKYQSKAQKMRFSFKKQENTSLFSNDQLSMESSLDDLFKRLRNHHHPPRNAESQKLQKHNKVLQSSWSHFESTRFFKRSLPTGVAFLNIWNIKSSKAVFYFLPLLSYQLSHDYLWLFFDLERDAEKMDLPPEIPKKHHDHNVVMIWRSRLYYMLRHVYFTTGSNTTGESRCSMFPATKQHSDTQHDRLLQLCKEKMIELAREMKIEHLVNLEKEMHVMATSNQDRIDELKKKADELVIKGFKSPTMVPLAHIFLRNTLYMQDRLYVDKQLLQEQAKKLNMDEKSFGEFCIFFISGGSIIDASLLGSQSPYIITKPIHFFSKLDQIFNHDKSKLVTLFGLFAFSVLHELLGEDAKFFMNVISAAGLGMEVCKEQILLSPLAEAHEAAIYYIPIAGRKQSHKCCNSTALHLRLTGQVLIRNIQVAFTREFLKSNHTAKLYFSSLNSLSTNMNCSSFDFEGIQFDIVCHGNETEFILCDESCTNDSVYEAIVDSCYTVLTQLIDNDVFFCFGFAFICNRSNEEIDFRFGRDRHLLPVLINEDPTADKCAKCELGLISRSGSSMWKWNKCLLDRKWADLLENDRYKPKFMSPQMSLPLLEKFATPLDKLSDDSVNQLALSMKFKNGVNEPSLKDYRGWRRLNIMILEYEKRFGLSMDGKIYHYLMRKLTKLKDSLKQSQNSHATEDQHILEETLATVMQQFQDKRHADKH